MNPDKESFSCIRSVVADPDHPEELLLDLGNELCERMGWVEGDIMEWTDLGDGTWQLRKKIPGISAKALPL